MRSAVVACVAGLLALILPAWPQAASAGFDNATIAESVARFSSKHIASIRRSIDRAISPGRIRGLDNHPPADTRKRHRAVPHSLDAGRVRRRGRPHRARFDTGFGHEHGRTRQSLPRRHLDHRRHDRRSLERRAAHFGDIDRRPDFERRRGRDIGSVRARGSVYRYRVIRPRQRTLRGR
ncbi:MAG: hypothetical protein ACR2PO_14635 [Methyloligellaceae bacterium]